MMLYAVTTQPHVFLILSISGFFCGFIFDFQKIFCFLTKNNKILTQISHFFSTFAIFFVFFMINLFENYGEIRIFAILGFFISFAIQRFLINNFVANPIIKCYNKLRTKENEKITREI